MDSTTHERLMRKIGRLCKGMLAAAVGVLAVTLYIYLRTRSGLAAWVRAGTPVPPNAAVDLINATRAAWFLVVPGLAVMFSGFALEILKALKKADKESQGEEPSGLTT